MSERTPKFEFFVSPPPVPPLAKLLDGQFFFSLILHLYVLFARVFRVPYTEGANGSILSSQGIVVKLKRVILVFKC